MDGKTIFANGINAKTGHSLPPLSMAEAVTLARKGLVSDKLLAAWLISRRNLAKSDMVGLPYDVDPRSVPEAGWCIVFPDNASTAIHEALKPLIAHRETQVQPDRIKELDYHSGETILDWLRRHDVAPGNIDPKKIPYYVLLIGDPTAIPFDFQCLLQVEYAVGRLAFDHPDQYRTYTQSIIDYDNSRTIPNSREVTYWAPLFSDNGFLQQSSEHLIKPLFESKVNEDEPLVAEERSFTSTPYALEKATKADLLNILHDSHSGKPPALLFAASHGLFMPKGDPAQYANQGALACPNDEFVTATDVNDDAHLHGMVSFIVACYGAGTPAVDSFLMDRNDGPQPITDSPFVAALPRRLLSHPKGGALAVVGHVERLWTLSFNPPGVPPQVTPFRNFLGRMMLGQPVGFAMKDFRERYATLAADLLSNLNSTQAVPNLSEEDLAWKWVECTDAQNYVILGDPAVRIRVDAFA